MYVLREISVDNLPPLGLRRIARCLLLSAVILLASACGGSAGKQASPTEASDPSIAFVERVGSPETASLFVADDGTPPRQIAAAPLGASELVWSPDQRRLAITLRQAAKGAPHALDPRIVVMDLDGSDQRVLVDEQTLGNQPDEAQFMSLTWSPDGRAIAFVRRVIPLTTTVYVVDVASGEARKLTDDDARCGDPDWAPDSSQLAYVCSAPSPAAKPAIFISAPDGANRRQLTAEDSGGVLPSWSPDGQRLAFEQGSGAPPQLDVISVDGSGLHEIAKNVAPLYRPAWSPDGRELAFVRAVGRGIAGPRTAVFRVDADGANLVEVTSDAESCFGASWSPGGGELAVACRANVGQNATPFPDTLAPLDVVVLNADGSSKRTVASGVLLEPQPSALPSWRTND